MTLKFVYKPDEITTIKENNDKKRKMLKELKKELIDRLDELRTEWRTPAGIVFMNEIDTSWAPYVERVCTILEAFNSILDSVETEDFKKLVEESGNIKFDGSVFGA